MEFHFASQRFHAIRQIHYSPSKRFSFANYYILLQIIFPRFNFLIAPALRLLAPFSANSSNIDLWSTAETAFPRSTHIQIRYLIGLKMNWASRSSRCADA